MGCQPCEERKQRLTAAVQEGVPLPPRDYAFYAGWALAFLAGGTALWLLFRGRT